MADTPLPWRAKCIDRSLLHANVAAGRADPVAGGQQVVVAAAASRASSPARGMVAHGGRWVAGSRWSGGGRKGGGGGVRGQGYVVGYVRPGGTLGWPRRGPAPPRPATLFLPHRRYMQVNNLPSLPRPHYPGPHPALPPLAARSDPASYRIPLLQIGTWLLWVETGRGNQEEKVTSATKIFY